MFLAVESAWLSASLAGGDMECEDAATASSDWVTRRQ